MNDRIELDLGRLPEPAPPATLAAVVMARVSRQHEERAQAATSRPSRTRNLRDLAGWAAALAGVVIVCVSWINGAHDGGSWSDLVSQLKAPNLESTPMGTSTGLGVLLGLLLYLAGLFAPPRSRDQHSNRSLM